MASENQQVYRQVYNSSEDVNQLSAIDNVTCVLFRRGVVAAAYNNKRQLLTIHYAAYGTDRPVWELDFFEPHFHQEPLLKNSELIKRIFFLTHINIIVPEELHIREEAEYWLKSIHFLEINDSIDTFQLKEDLAEYYYAVPLYIRELAKINAHPEATFMPLSAYQFIGNYTKGVRFHCLLSTDQACITICHFGTMLWHRVIDYSSAEDIVYYVRLVCQEHKINAEKIMLLCNTLSAAEHDVAKELAAYFAGFTTGNGGVVDTFWAPVMSLFKQLETCA